MKKSGIWKKSVAALLALVVTVAVWQTKADAPEAEASSTISEINKQLEQVKKQAQEAAATRRSAEQESKEVLAQKNEVAQSVNELSKQIDEIGQQRNNVQQQIDKTEQDLMEAGQEKEEASARVVARKKMLDSRLQLMYQNGVVSYIDVLMSSTSFTDFIDRFDALQSIVNQDKDILEQHKKDKALIIQKEAEIKEKFNELSAKYEKLENYEAMLEEKEKAKKQLIAQLNDKMAELEDISEEQEKVMLELAQKTAELERKKREEQKKQTVFYTGGKLAVPIKDPYRISDPFGYRIHPIYHTKKLHAGLDMAAPAGTNIYAAESGVVITAGWTNGYGYTVILDHGNGLWTLYGHIRKGGIKVKVGDNVKRGEKIAEVGSTGNSTGNHLHFEVRLNGTAKDPNGYLK
ncbi:murein hydrolase activator EnvC family protein [Paenibacillus xylaniclasticus]|uniref:murein hydrolase activator EnvC family protein n=1 Tax=Paenibacillus xylaniclasticus TaxID=588083 RepID=UPI000FD8A54B|nr:MULTISPECIES: M23 family metallopeptidase [Paenibacillus]GFN32631.1 metalloendopeptidase [Paenibacillus curdlanolyticus]